MTGEHLFPDLSLVIQIRWVVFFSLSLSFTRSPVGLIGQHLLPPLTCQSVHSTQNNDNWTTHSPTSLQVGSPINRHPRSPTFPTPCPTKAFLGEMDSLLSLVSPRRAYREATVSVPGVRPSCPGGAAFRSRRWSAWLLSPPRWGNTPLWIPGSFSLLKKKKHTHTHFSAFSLLYWFIQMSDSAEWKTKKTTKQEACGSQITSSCRPGCVEITRGRPYNESEQRTDCAGEENWIFEKFLTPTSPPSRVLFASSTSRRLQNSVQSGSRLISVRS